MTLMSRFLQSLRSYIRSNDHAARRQAAYTENHRFVSTEQFEARTLLTAGFADNRVILSLQSGVSPQAIVNSYPGSQIKPLGHYGLFLVTLPAATTPTKAVAKFKAIPGVNFAEPDWEITPEAIPNDPQFSTQWGLQNVGQSVGGNGGTPGADTDATLAWNTVTGSKSVIVAIVDTGIDYTHADLAANMWVNPGEIPGNGIDDDNNGYVDDINGWDFGDDDANPAPDPGVGNDHGTHVAGIAGAVGNNGIGVSGVNWNVSLMAIKVFPSGNKSFISAAVEGLNYAVDMGAFVSNHSYNTGTGGPIQAYQAAVV